MWASHMIGRDSRICAIPCLLGCSVLAENGARRRARTLTQHCDMGTGHPKHWLTCYADYMFIREIFLDGYSEETLKLSSTIFFMW